MKRLALLLATIVTISLFNTMPLQATASKDFPDTGSCGDNVCGPVDMSLQVEVQPIAPLGPKIVLNSGEVGIPSTTAGAAINDILIQALCLSCDSIGDPSTVGCPLGGATFTCTVGGFPRITVTNSDAVPAGVLVDAVPAVFPAPPFPTPTSRLTGYVSTTDGRNEVVTDLLPDLQVQITPRGAGTVFVFHIQKAGSALPDFQVSANQKQQQIAQAVRDGFIGWGYPAAQITTGEGKSMAPLARFPQVFSGYSTRVRNVTTLGGNAVTSISITSTPPANNTDIHGDRVTVENSEPPTPPGVPAVSEWTIALFIGLLLLMGTWLLRRRLTPQAPQAV